MRVGMSQLAPRAWGARRVAVGTSLLSLSSRHALSGIEKSFLFSPKIDTRPQLILVGGCTGTGKSAFGMSVALEQVCGCFEMASSRRRMRPRVSFKSQEFLEPRSLKPTVLSLKPVCHHAFYFAARNRDQT